jgi:uncharacterized protein
MSVDPAGAVEAANALNQAIQDGDPGALRRVYAPDAIVWHNTDGVELTREEVIGGVEDLRAASEIRIEVIRREATSDGFVQTQRFTFTPPSGPPVVFTSAFWVVLNTDGQIVRLDDFIDSAAVAAMGDMISRHSLEAGPPLGGHY